MAIFVALGANLPSERFGPPQRTLEAALELLDSRGFSVRARSSWYESAPVPASNQPWFVNGVARLDGPRDPAAALDALHRLEAALGRVRSVRNAARAVDLDLLDLDGRVSGPADWPRLPHPRLQERAFVLMPLAEIAPDWCHPTLGATARALLDALGDGQTCRPLPSAGRQP